MPDPAPQGPGPHEGQDGGAVSSAAAVSPTADPQEDPSPDKNAHPMRQRSGCSAVSAEMVEHVSAGKVGEAAQSVIILALKEEVADQVHLIGAVSEGPRH